ncbi:MAG: hypothetical protein J6Y86_10810 [Pseudobutyrivibrio sp.]|nr:hypothetical protein [Pseudobutyrivibrio sp.]
MANVKLPEENLEDLAPFLIAMHTFYELALKGTLFAQELDRRKADAEIKEKLSNKRVEKKSFEDNAFKSVKEVAAMLGLPEDAIQDFLFLDLNTGECCEAHRKYKK